MFPLPLGSLILAIETSSSPFGVVIGEDNKILFNSVDHAQLRDSRDIPFLVEQGLNAINGHVKDIEALAVNIGPGGLSSVRSGVAFANALAFGLKAPIFPFTLFELIGFDVWSQYHLPVLCTARATQGRVYAGLYDKGRVISMRFGSLETIVPPMTALLPEFVVAGRNREEILKITSLSKVHDSGIQQACAKTIFEILSAKTREQIDAVPPHPKSKTVFPLTEQSPVFYE